MSRRSRRRCVITRRRLLAAGGLAGIAAAPSLVRKAAEQFAPLPEFEQMADPVGFRRVSGGSISAGGNPFAGLEAVSDTSPDLPIAEVRRNLCGALYGEQSFSHGMVPLASFSDFYCPYCRIQTKKLTDLAERWEDKVRIVWHELPLLGEASLRSAKAALAAKQQDAYVRFQEHLISTPFRPTKEYLEALSEAIGVSHTQLVADMNSDDVLQEIQTSAALAEIFGFIGTPALVIGRTVIQGQISTSTIERIIEFERSEGWSRVC